MIYACNGSSALIEIRHQTPSFIISSDQQLTSQLTPTTQLAVHLVAEVERLALV